MLMVLLIYYGYVAGFMSGLVNAVQGNCPYQIFLQEKQ